MRPAIISLICGLVFLLIIEDRESRELDALRLQQNAFADCVTLIQMEWTSENCPQQINELLILKQEYFIRLTELAGENG